MAKPSIPAKVTVQTTRFLKANQYAPQVFLFRNIESGQVVYSQTPAVEKTYMYEQFLRPNWENKRPTTRRDIWKCMCVVELNSYDDAVDTFQALVDLRTRRDVTDRLEVRGQRVRNQDGNIWFSGQFRPTYAMESVADLSTVIEEFQLADTKILWEDLWRKGDDKHWDTTLVEHQELPRLSSRNELAVLKELRAAKIEQMDVLKGENRLKNKQILEDNGIKIEGVEQ
ncbi:hypothetical protein BABINDRAFT_160450 [Babjeviella inositovora NRRL Y-12698]|uniref:Large ribosomal subunit protein mL67 n=1 Tax=Babjeviella inositovora NRRL Y-12698 TaxID=984486 RepID=A0A1E3QTM1_9ASCO|nr:uncharacterized protein BABINDRAFT_160450 [Babjeviella inositovora NRRL Y-12698]ODQ81031.1 hypothetical protein BABINDRAFT_160450 [Babjeviella inositovora NRRL Y-12698]